MARTYGQIMSAIWSDASFRKLRECEQRAYLMLVTQATISSCGVLALTVGRWSTYAVDSTADGLRDALSGLERHAFVVVDNVAEELLVRKFVKWDRGYANEKRRPAITTAANAVTSPEIRAVLARELNELGVPHNLSDSLSDSPSDTASDRPRVVVTLGEYVPDPDPESITGGPKPMPPFGGTPQVSPFCEKHPNGTTENCRDCATARRRWDLWRRNGDALTRAAADERARNAKACPDCFGDDWLLNDQDEIVGKCTHPRLRRNA